VGGWKVVVKKGEYNVGELAVYLEIDSWVPTALAPFLSKGKEPREYDGVKGERLRTVKLRGQLSQGLLLPVYQTSVGNFIHGIDANGSPHKWTVTMEQDVSELLGIQKWEKPMNAQLAGMAKGNFPSLIPKTDQERAQNLTKEIAACKTMHFEVTEKLEGSSMTVYKIGDTFGVCSRNLDLKEDENNAFWKAAIENNIKEKIMSLPYDIAIQGELIGPGIQGNIYKLSKPEFRVFDCYHINSGKYFEPAVRRHFVDSLELLHVPVLFVDKDLGVGSVEEILQWAEDKSKLNPSVEREGIVFKHVAGGMTFKSISNKYLLGETQ
jgi:RNA ligase (TIGR02306 family)